MAFVYARTRSNGGLGGLVGRRGIAHDRQGRGALRSVGIGPAVLANALAVEGRGTVTAVLNGTEEGRGNG